LTNFGKWKTLKKKFKGRDSTKTKILWTEQYNVVGVFFRILRFSGKAP